MCGGLHSTRGRVRLWPMARLIVRMISRITRFIVHACIDRYGYTYVHTHIEETVSAQITTYPSIYVKGRSLEKSLNSHAIWASCKFWEFVVLAWQMTMGIAVVHWRAFVRSWWVMQTTSTRVLVSTCAPWLVAVVNHGPWPESEAPGKMFGRRNLCPEATTSWWNCQPLPIVNRYQTVIASCIQWPTTQPQL